MKQKFIINDNHTKNELYIEEYAYLEREHKKNLVEANQEPFALLCEETYDKALILSAISKGKKNLVSAIRTRNMYPTMINAEKIADSIIEMYHTQSHLPVELLFDDSEDFESKES